MALRVSAALGLREGLFLFPEILEMLLRDVLDQSFEPAAVVNPLADHLVEGPGDVGTNLLFPQARVEIESRMLLPALAATIVLAAGTVTQHQ
jgi:hypothetical protein